MRLPLAWFWQDWPDRMRPLTLSIALAASLLSSIQFIGQSFGQSFDLSSKCQKEVDQEFIGTGLSDFRKSVRPIDPAAFVKNDVGQYPAYLLVSDAASKTLVGELLSHRDQNDALADEMITWSDQGFAKVVFFTKNKKIVGYSSLLLAQGAGKSVILDSQCKPVSVHIALPPVSPPYMNPVISVNRSDCSHLIELTSLAKNVEISANESIFDGLCKVRGGVVRPASHSLDDDLACECPNGESIQPELEVWSGASHTCLNPPRLSSTDRFSALISSKGSLVNGGLQALVSQLKSPHSVFAQQCRHYFR
jgi:hypothetical protein